MITFTSLLKRVLVPFPLRHHHLVLFRPGLILYLNKLFNEKMQPGVMFQNSPLTIPIESPIEEFSILEVPISILEFKGFDLLRGYALGGSGLLELLEEIALN